MKKFASLLIVLTTFYNSFAQIDPELLRHAPRATDSLQMNMDAIYARPFFQIGRLPVAIGGYAEANYQYLAENGIAEGHEFQMRRMSVFLSSGISQRLRFLSEIEFEDGAKEINLEYAAVDLALMPLLNFRGGILLNPIGSFNQNHDGPKWEFVDRPFSSTQMLPATFSNAGVGVFGKKYKGEFAIGYEISVTNSFNENIIQNQQNKTYLPATKNDPERFEENFNGSLLFTGKMAIRVAKLGEAGISFMHGGYNKFRDDGIDIDKKRNVRVIAVDFSRSMEEMGTEVKGEWAWVKVDVPLGYAEQFGSRQQGGFFDIVQRIRRGNFWGFTGASINAALRIDYVDWNRGRFKSTARRIGDHLVAFTPALSFRPTNETVFRINYRFQWNTDLLGNPPVRIGVIQIGVATYF